MTARGDREAADRLDALEGLVALMLAHGFAEQPAQQPHIIVQPMVAFPRLGLLRRGGRGSGGGAAAAEALLSTFMRCRDPWRSPRAEASL